MKIPVAMIDDSEADRYILRRRLSRRDDFEIIAESSTGDRFVQEFFCRPRVQLAGIGKLLVMLDINLPRLDGFETVARMESCIARGDGPDSCVVLMCTTSANAKDRARAESHATIKGYFVKPLTAACVDRIHEIYASA